MFVVVVGDDAPAAMNPHLGMIHAVTVRIRTCVGVFVDTDETKEVALA